jgi:phospholipase C
VRLPFLAISPYARPNYVDHSLNDLTSILRFIESNWRLGTIGDPQSFDVLASGTIMGMFDFTLNNRALILNPSTGRPADE